MKQRDIAGALRRVFYLCFALCFAALLVGAVFLGRTTGHYPHYRAPFVLVFAVVWAGVVWVLYRLCGRFAGLLQRRERLFLLGFFALEIVAMLVFYQQLATYPTLDFERVHTAAVNYTVNGFIEEPYLTYFARFPNNMPITILLQFVFRAFHRLGYSNFYVVGALVNAVCILLGYAFVYLCCRRLFGVQRGFLALGLLFLCLPLQCYIGIYYTDTTTLWFAPFAFYMYLRLHGAQSVKGKAAAIAVLVAGTALGTHIKYSVVISVIAIALDMLLRKAWRQLLALAGAFLVCFAAFGAFFTAQKYARFLDRETAEEMATPFSAWIMMGLSGDGSHNAEDNYLVWNYETRAEMEDAANAELTRRLGEFTPGSFVAFMYQKALKSWGSGNMSYTSTAAGAPMRQTFLVEAVDENGTQFWWFDHVTQGYHVMLLGLLVAGAVVMARKREYAVFVPYLAVFGLFLFLLLWESGNRYLINYTGMLVVAAAGAADTLLPPKCEGRTDG